MPSRATQIPNRYLFSFTFSVHVRLPNPWGWYLERVGRRRVEAIKKGILEADCFMPMELVGPGHPPASLSLYGQGARRKKIKSRVAI